MLADRQLYPKSSHVLKKQFQVNLWFSDKRTSGILFVSNKHACMCWQGDKQTRDKHQFYAIWIWTSLKQVEMAQGYSTHSSCLGPSLLLTSMTHTVTTAIVAGETCHQWSELLPEVLSYLMSTLTTQFCHKDNHLSQKLLPFPKTNPSPRVTLAEKSHSK